MAQRVVSWRSCAAAYCRDGSVEVHRNSQGAVDYWNGAPTGEIVPCAYCGGTGLEPDEVEQEADHA